jgi:hypothetical protein
MVDELGYSSKEAFRMSFCLQEAYANAVIHGNKGGTAYYYESRKRDVPEDLEANKDRKVDVKLDLHKDFYLMRVLDEGNSVPDKRINRSIDEDGMPLAEDGRGFQLFNDPKMSTAWGFECIDERCQFYLYKERK